jgi:hypothetical protein
MDLPTVEEVLDKIEEGSGIPAYSLRTRFTTPDVVQRSDPIRKDSGSLVEEKAVVAFDDWTW